jgi:predicted permease
LPHPTFIAIIKSLLKTGERVFIESFKITGLAVAQIFILGALGFFLVKKNILGDVGLDALSRMTIEITLPCLMFSSVSGSSASGSTPTGGSIRF